MITVKALYGPRFRFRHAKVYLIEEEKGYVTAFAVVLMDTPPFPGEPLSRAKAEMNQTMWNPESTKRPKGYNLCAKFTTPTYKGVTPFHVTIFVEERRLIGMPRKVYQEQITEWSLGKWLETPIMTEG